VLVFNQIDRLPPGMGEMLAKRHDAVPISALDRRGLRELLERVSTQLWRDDIIEPEGGRPFAAGGRVR